MTGISSSVGLISGIDYTSLVDQLMAIEAQPKDRLQSRTDILSAQYDAMEELLGLLLKSTYMINNLNKVDAFNRCDVSSSNDAALSATKNGTPTEGSYTFTPIRTAQAQQTIASGVASDSTALGQTGTITIGSGWTLEQDVSLTNINGGSGFDKGYIRITDGTGTRATIDLRNVSTINDVVDAINNTHSIDVFAEIVEDRLVLSDQSGVAAEDSKFAVADVTGGTTASSLGLSGKTASDGYIIGDSIYRLGEDMYLSQLNDGLGIVTDNMISDFKVDCKDGSTVTIDFSKRATTTEIEAGAQAINKELTLGDLIDTINNSTDANGVAGKIRASIGEDGKSLVLTDTTSRMIANPDYDSDLETSETNPLQIADPTATTTMTQLSTSPVLKSLGFISGDYTEPLVSTDGTFTTGYLLGGLTSPLMSSMNGGYGLSGASAGEIEVQDRAGNTATISFTQEELDLMQTFEDAVYVLNYKFATAELDSSTAENPRYGIGLEVKMNDTKTGFQIVDTTGSTSANIIIRDKVTEHTETVENEDGEEENVTTTTTPGIAQALGLEVDAARNSVSGESLNMQVYSYSTKLSDLNGGAGVTMAGAKITITDSSGKTDTISFNSTDHQTLGDVINAITRSTANVTARLNDAGDGILIEDIAGGTGNLSIFDSDSTSKFASSLNIAQVAKQADKVGDRLQIDGSQTYKIEVEATDTLDDIRKKINDAGGNFNATIVYDGTDTPYRLSISSKTTGAAGAMNIDLSCLGLKTETMTEARDAILVFGDASTDSGVHLYSSSNTFKNVVNGIDLTIGTVSDTPTPVTITSEKSSVEIKASLKTFVENYNAFKQTLNAYTYFEVTDDGVAGSTLYNNSVARQLDREIVNILQKQVYGITGINSLQSLGISIQPSNYSSDESETTEEEEKEKIITTGNLIFDEDVFDAAYEANPDGVRDFFYQSVTQTDASGKEVEVKTGWAQTFMTAAEKVTGDTAGNSLGKIYYEMQTLQNKIDQNKERIDFMQGRLDVKRQQMLNKFYAMETALAQMSTDMTTVSSIASSWSSNYSASGSTTGY